MEGMRKRQFSPAELTGTKPCQPPASDGSPNIDKDNLRLCAEVASAQYPWPGVAGAHVATWFDLLSTPASKTHLADAIEYLHNDEVQAAEGHLNGLLLPADLVSRRDSKLLAKAVAAIVQHLVTGLKIWPKTYTNHSEGSTVNAWIGVQPGLQKQTELWVRTLKRIADSPAAVQPASAAGDTVASVTDDVGATPPFEGFHVLWVVVVLHADPAAFQVVVASESGSQVISISSSALERAVVCDTSSDRSAIDLLSTARSLVVCKLHATRRGLAATHLKVFADKCAVEMETGGSPQLLKPLLESLVSVDALPSSVAPSHFESHRRALDDMCGAPVSDHPSVTLAVGVSPRVIFGENSPPSDGKTIVVLLAFVKQGKLVVAGALTAPEFEEIDVIPRHGMITRATKSSPATPDGTAFLLLALRPQGESAYHIAFHCSFAQCMREVGARILDVGDEFEAWKRAATAVSRTPAASATRTAVSVAAPPRRSAAAPLDPLLPTDDVECDEDEEEVEDRDNEDDGDGSYFFEESEELDDESEVSSESEDSAAPAAAAEDALLDELKSARSEFLDSLGTLTKTPAAEGRPSAGTDAPTTKAATVTATPTSAGGKQTVTKKAASPAAAKKKAGAACTSPKAAAKKAGTKKAESPKGAKKKAASKKVIPPAASKKKTK